MFHDNFGRYRCHYKRSFPPSHSVVVAESRGRDKIRLNGIGMVSVDAGTTTDATQAIWPFLAVVSASTFNKSSDLDCNVSDKCGQ